MKPRFLIVDDESSLRSALAEILRREGYRVDAVESGEECIEKVGRRSYDVIMLDVWLPGMDGLATLEKLRASHVEAQIVVISGDGNIESAVRAIKLGAFDFVEKPLSSDKTLLVARNAVRQRHLEIENRELREHVDRRTEMVGASTVMNSLRDQISMASPTNGRVLIYGANGTGKELVARSVHALSRRASGPFVEVNCAAIPEELIESELFGYSKGAFTGAVGNHQGKFEAADGGTIFLDEVGDMSLKTQAKVLRVLQEPVVEPLGGRDGVKIDVRVIAATNKDLVSEIREGRFRDDLFFRLNVLPIFVPPLSDRPTDIPLLADYFMKVYAEEYGHRLKVVDDEARAVLQSHTWPGNVRELRNVIERLVIMVPGERIGRSDLTFLHGGTASAMTSNEVEDIVLSLQEARERFERDYIVSALAENQGNISRAAIVLGVERSNLYRKMRAFGITSRRLPRA